MDLNTQNLLSAVFTLIALILVIVAVTRVCRYLDKENGGCVLPISTNNKDGRLKMTAEQGKEQCSICLDALNTKKEVAVLRNCNHKFHYQCIVDWTCTSASCDK